MGFVSPIEKFEKIKPNINHTFKEILYVHFSAAQAEI